MVNINAFIAALKIAWLRKIITDNNSPWSIILQSMTDTKSVFNLGTHFITEKILPNIKKTSFGKRYSHPTTNSNKEHTNRDTTIPNHSNFLQ